MTNAVVPHLAEMIDTYLTLHDDYLKTDSISASETLKTQLNNIEKDMKERGCKIIYSTVKWKDYICNLPTTQSYSQLAAEILKDVDEGLESDYAPIVLEVLRSLDNAVFGESSKKITEQKFYAKTDIMEIVDGNTLVKHVMFSDINIIQKIKNIFSHES